MCQILLMVDKIGIFMWIIVLECYSVIVLFFLVIVVIDSVICVSLINSSLSS